MTPVDLAILAFIASIPASSAILFNAFAAVSGFKRLYDNPRLWRMTPIGMKLVAYVNLVLGALADAYFNWTRGAWIFREWPWSHGTIMFTQRVQWHLDNSRKTRNINVALKWAELGNAIAPGHFHIGR
jgi:hypothetical protein